MTFSKVYDSADSLPTFPLTKSANEGPVFSLSRNIVVRLRVGAFDIDGEDVADDSELVVA